MKDASSATRMRAMDLPPLDLDWDSLRGPERALDRLARAHQEDPWIDDADHTAADRPPLGDELAAARRGARAVDEPDDAVDRHAEAAGLVRPPRDDEQVRRRRQRRLGDLEERRAAQHGQRVAVQVHDAARRGGERRDAPDLLDLRDLEHVSDRERVERGADLEG